MSRLWVKLIKHHRMVRQEAIPCAWGEEKQALIEQCREFDVPAPMWLNKHEHEFEQFRHTAFTKEHFVEEISFDRMEIEYLEDDGKKRKSMDPRNQF